MNQTLARRVAERFATLPLDQRRAVYDKMRAQGLTLDQLPILLQADGEALVASHAQQRQWFLWRLDPANTAYHLAGAVRLKGPLDDQAVRNSFHALAARHASLRTVFTPGADGQAVPSIQPLPRIDIPLVNLTDHAATQRKAQAQEAARRLIDAPFDLTQGPLLRVALLRLASNDHVLVLVMHHIVSDGWSMRILIDEFAAAYAAFVRGQAPNWPALPVRYTDHACWQRQWLEAGEAQRQLAYWREALGDAQPVLQLPVDHPRSATGRYDRASHLIELPPTLVTALHARAKDSGASLFMVLLAGFQVVLHRYTGQEDIRVGVPIANRHRAETAGLVGFFVNTQVLRGQLTARTPLGDVLAQAKQAVLGAQAHQDLPFEQLVDALQAERSLGQNPLFQVMHNHQHQDHSALQSLPGLAMSTFELDGQAAQFELVLDTTEHPDGRVQARFTYAKALFDPATIERLGRHYQAALHSLAEAPERSVHQVALLNAAELDQLWQWGHGEPLQAADFEPVHALIERQARRRPQATALIFGETTLSYGDLDARANRLAHHLLASGLPPEGKVGLAVARSIDMVVGMLAVMKAGGACVPLDPGYPAGRLAYMIEDSRIDWLLTQREVGAALSARLTGALWQSLRVIEIDALDLTASADQSPQNPPNLHRPLHPEQLAYIIYTSGSTGQPKGVAVAHGPLAMHVRAIGQAYGMTPQDRELQFASINFDGAHERIWVPLAFGAALMPRGDEAWSVERTCAEIARHGITIACFTPSYLHQMAELMGESARSLPIRSYTVGGEAMPRATYELVQAVLRPPRLINGYGPTETVITPMMAKAGPDMRFESASMPIGRLVGERTAHVLDEALNLVPAGVAGELYLGGTGLARGYLHRPGLTSERFVADPFDERGGRLYRTGDLVRWRADGELEYLGRVDHQVKVRGFRIELGEVEAQLLAQPGVNEAVVVARPGPGGSRLVAYLTARAGTTLSVDALRDALLQAMPDYMVPAAMVVLPAMPLNPNGKIDRQALPEPVLSARADHDAPQGDAEQALAALWARVLGLPRVGRHDNFFELGGDSILSLQIVAHARRAGWHITPRQLFERQTVAALAAVAQACVSDVAASKVNAVVEGAVPLLPIQSDFFRRDMPARHHWNQSVLLRAPRPWAHDALLQALQAVLDHHDGLRLRFTQDEQGTWHQAYAPAPLMAKEALWIRQVGDASGIEALCEEAQRSLDLASGPLLRVVAMTLNASSPVSDAQAVKLAEGRLLLVAHHLIVDGVSWRVLLEDLHTAYEQCLAGQAVALPDTTASYQAWALQQQAQAHLHEDELPHWHRLVGAPVSLSCDHPAGSHQVRHQADVTVRLDRNRTAALLKEAPAAYRTQVNDLLLTALGRALCQWSGHERMLVNLEGHGREAWSVDMDVSRTVGWFTCVYPVLLDAMGEGLEMGAAIQRVKEALRQVPRKGMGHGALQLGSKHGIRSVIEALPRPQVVFNYLGQFDAHVGDAAWSLAPESAGQDIDADAPLDHELSINGRVLSGELTLTISFSRARWQLDNITAFAQLLEDQLHTVITHCLSGVKGVTPSDFPLACMSQADLDGLPIDPGVLQDLYPLSPMQAGMLFHTVYDDASPAYLNQLRVDIDGLDSMRFRDAWQAALDRHDVLRTGFLQRPEQPLQWVARHVALPTAELDWQDHPSQRDALDELAQAELAQGFDLQKPPLMRLAIVRTSAQSHHVIWTVHHLLLDGWSTSQLMGEVLRHYGGEAVPAPAGRYRDHVAWLQSRDALASEVFWRAQLQGVEEPTLLADAVCKPTTAQGQHSGQDQGHAQCRCELPIDTTNKLRALARQERVTLNTVVQAAWGLLLRAYTGKASVVFGGTVAGRPAEVPGAEQWMGLFINTLPVIASPAPGQTLGDWLRDLQAQNLAAREHEHTPLYDIQRWSGLGGQSLFDSILVFENFPVDQAVQQASPSGLRLSGVRHQEQTSFPMTVAVLPGQTLTLLYSHALSCFDRSTVAAMASQMQHLLEAFPASVGQAVDELAVSTHAEQQTLRRWGSGEHPTVSHLPVHRLIEDHARVQPDALALIFGEVTLSRGELNARANRLAHHLRRIGVRPESRVGLSLERSVDMVVGLLAILKAGGAYVPLDPDYPEARLTFMMQDSGIELLLTHSHLLGRLPMLEHMPRVLIDTLDTSHECPDNPMQAVHPDSLAYLIYTSGSTGRPKGVAVSHGPLSMHVQSIGQRYGMVPQDRELQFASINFDGAHERLWVPLAFGAALMPRGPELWSPERTCDEIQRHGITVACFTPSYLYEMAELVGERARSLPIRSYTVGGEAMSRAHFERVQAVLRPPRIINGYGPTETVITPMIAVAGPGDSFDAAYMPIGHVVGDRTAYILDARMNPVPPQASGELYLGGAGLARGYVGQPGLSAERFVADPFDDRGGRLYRTGDLVRWAKDGQIDYLGRVDHQVKIRGYRIELGDIEAQLLAQPGVHQAVALARTGLRGDRLLAYVVPQPGTALHSQALVRALNSSLPSHMVPSAIVVLPGLPLTPNGKVDRQALPDPVQAGVADGQPPQGPVEEMIAREWMQVLGIAQVGRDDNFFELGGHSLMAMRLVHAIRERAPSLGITLRRLMAAPTVREMAATAGDATSAVISLNTSPFDRTPLFCVHDGWGSVLDYLPLGRALQSRCLVLGLPFNLAGSEVQGMKLSIDDLIERHCQTLLIQQPQGPYRLFGWSLGGMLALRMAGCLEQRGHEVSCVHVVDPYVPGEVLAPPPSLDSALREFLGLLLPTGARERGQADPDLQRAISEADGAMADIEHVLSKALRGVDGASLHEYAALSQRELAMMFLTSRQLALAALASPGLDAVQAPVHVWWMKDRPMADRHRLAQRLGASTPWAQTILEASHLETVRHPALLAGVSQSLS